MKDLPPILYEDDVVVAFDKPAGLLVAPDRWDKSIPNLMDLIHARRSRSIYNVHRLDRDTSGIVLCTRTPAALRMLARAFETRDVSKEYACLVRKAPSWEERTVERELAPDPASPGRMRPVWAGGRPAVTRLHVLERWTGYTLIQALPLTGRTHQIRVHLALEGFPILADPVYGDGRGLYLSSIKPDYKFKRDREERPLIGRLALHAAALTFPHPGTGQRQTIRCPYPHDFEIALKYLSRFAPAPA